MRLGLYGKRIHTKCFSTSLRSRALGPIKLDYSVLDDPAKLANQCRLRKVSYSQEQLEELRQLHIDSKGLARSLEEHRAQQNALTKSLKGHLEQSKRSEIIEEASNLSKKVANLADLYKAAYTRLEDEVSALPNASHPSAPEGGYEACRIVRTSGPSVKSEKAQAHKDHLSIAQQLQWVDFAAGAKVTGSGWYFLLNEGALLELALTNYATSMAITAGYVPAMTPDVTKTQYAERCGFQPRDEAASQSYNIQQQGSSDSLTLAGTAEIPLAGYFSESVLVEKDLPAKLVGFGRAFRAEAGARGKESRGLYRVHQFSKVELFVVCAKEESEELLEDLVRLQESILSGLGLSLRTMEMSTEELGASAYRKYDIEAWMPGRGSWGEVASASNCTDYQSHRLDIRYKPTPTPQTPPAPTKRIDDLDIPIPPHIEATAVLQHDQPKKKEGKTIYAHTLNATAAAIPRLILALIENGARFDRGGEPFVELPRVLKGFWAGPSDDVGVKQRNTGRYVIKWV